MGPVVSVPLTWCHIPQGRPRVALPAASHWPRTSCRGRARRPPRAHPMAPILL